MAKSFLGPTVPAYDPGLHWQLDFISLVIIESILTRLDTPSVLFVPKALSAVLISAAALKWVGLYS